MAATELTVLTQRTILFNYDWYPTFIDPEFPKQQKFWIIKKYRYSPGMDWVILVRCLNWEERSLFEEVDTWSDKSHSHSP